LLATSGDVDPLIEGEVISGRGIRVVAPISAPDSADWEDVLLRHTNDHGDPPNRNWTLAHPG
jgi:hypothetical protein